MLFDSKFLARLHCYTCFGLVGPIYFVELLLFLFVFLLTGLEKFAFWLSYFSLNTVTVENHESRDPFVLKV